VTTDGNTHVQVRITTGEVRGTTVDGMCVFRGIPYARPPVGELRLAAPVPACHWDGVRDALEFGPPPPQSTLIGVPVGHPESGDAEDDWLTLNIWTPDTTASGLPVMVWIHGGGYSYGWSGDPLFDGAALASDGVVVMTFNYRVHAEGFASIPGAPPNRGLLDQVAALRWVQENIAAFGGDPDAVTVIGESAGAGSIAALLAMPAATGLFHRAILQSVPGLLFTDDLASDIGSTITDLLGVEHCVDAVRGLSPHLLNEAADIVAASIGDERRWGIAAHVGSPFAPVVDGEILPTTPWQALDSGAAADIDLVVGHTRDEYRLFMVLKDELGRVSRDAADAALALLAPDAEAFRAAYPAADPEALYQLVHSDYLFRMPSLQLAQAHRGNHYVYEIRWPAPGMGGDLLGACHGLGLPLTFGNLTAGAAALLVGTDPGTAATELSRAVRGAWTGFAATGDPGWPRYDDSNDHAWIIDAVPRVEAYPEHVSRRLWAEYLFTPLDLAATR
jgi:para-nitrobenzyl esterase